MDHNLFGPIVLWAAIGGLSATASASDETKPPCLAGMRPALVQAHFTGPIICSTKDASFVLVGRTRRSGFRIYDYRYKFRPQHGNVTHGGQRVVVVRGGIYVGQYLLAPPPYAKVTVSGPYVSLQRLGAAKVKLDFEREPPRQTLFDGEVELFSR
ncbi:hypothetical protein [Sphingomonas aerophila]|uniref:Uncharacterized protein n=1 Tax=Sphingomonas aerophila TaxID=1344948 RepID=A0A7W9BG75_9SPHN|nr:hypothetical protein [Sphingomonas aerophila]MBB5716458.1 hypothetical protein [Sphingomonas aerophila]